MTTTYLSGLNGSPPWTLAGAPMGGYLTDSPPLDSWINSFLTGPVR
jgi:hypothetical protein